MNLDAYLERLNLNIYLDNNFKTLQSLHRAHAFTIAFENFNVHLKRAIPLDEESLFQKLILEKRGGYCYELNILFSFLLQEIGFHVTHLIGRPLYGYNNALRPRTHMVLKVETEGKEYLCDLGFGGRGLIEPIELIFDKENIQFHDIFKLIPHYEGYELQSYISEGWVSLYSFDLHEQQLIDYELANFYNMHSLDSRFTQQIICAKPTNQGRILLVDKKFKYYEDGKSKIVIIQTAKEYDEILHKYFGFSALLAEKLFVT